MEGFLLHCGYCSCSYKDSFQASQRTDTGGSGFKAITIDFSESIVIATSIAPEVTTIIVPTTKQVVPSASLVPSPTELASHASAIPSTA